METCLKFWNIFQCILETLGEDGFKSANSHLSLLNEFKNILTKLQVAAPIIDMIINFINLAWRVFKWVRSTFFQQQQKPLQN